MEKISSLLAIYALECTLCEHGPSLRNIKTKSKVRAAARGSTSEKRHLAVDVGTIWWSPGRQARNTVVYKSCTSCAVGHKSDDPCLHNTWKQGSSLLWPTVHGKQRTHPSSFPTARSEKSGFQDRPVRLRPNRILPTASEPRRIY